MQRSSEPIQIQIHQLFEQFLLEGDTNPYASMPLVCPWIVKKMAEVLDIDIVDEYYQVPNIKTFLKTFLLQYRLEGFVSPTEIQAGLEMIVQARIKHKAATDSREEKLINSYSKNVEIYCAECNLIAAQYCTNCMDPLCEDCCSRLHTKGTRLRHWINRIIRCSMCHNFPARLQCTCTFETFCIDCYSRKHVKTLPKYLDLKPLRIDYTLCIPRVERLGDVVHASLHTADDFAKVPLSCRAIHFDWHPFLDSLGIEYHYNFRTEESVRLFEPQKETIPTSDRLKKRINKIKFDISPKCMPDQLSRAQLEILTQT